MNQPVALFPLPDLVFFPGTLLPLHVFEPRYRQMAADQVSGSGLIAMALLEEGWEKDYFGAPPIHPVVTVGAIRRHELLPDGRYNLELLGLERARVQREVPGRPYRQGVLEPLVERVVGADEAEDVRRRLVQGLRQVVGGTGPPPPVVMLHPTLSLGGLCDRLASLLPLPIRDKQGLLEEQDPVARSLALLHHLEGLRDLSRVRRPQRPFPGFSAN